MPLTLDHVVIAVADLEAAMADYGALGFTVTPGGEHGGGITHNALIAFHDGAYLELIAFRRADPDNRWWQVFERAGEGFVDYALLPGDTAADVRTARERGLDFGDPVPGSRLRPDGERLAWQIARSPGSDVPFLCGDVTPRGLRVPEGPARQHPNGVTGIAEMVIAVEDANESRRRYAALLGSPNPSAARGEPPAEAPIQIGNVRVRLLSATHSREGTGEVAAALRARGQGPFSLGFAGSGRSGDLDPARSHGARLRITPPSSAR